MQATSPNAIAQIHFLRCGKIRLLLIGFFALSLGFAKAQPQKTQNIDDVQIVFEKSKEIVLPLSEKPFTNRQQNLKADTITRDYTSLAKDMMLPTNTLDIKPRVLNYLAGDEAKGKSNYIKVGIGNYATTHLEGLYTHGTKEDYIAAKILHFNSALGSEKWQANGVNQLDVFGTYKALKGRLKANLLVENNRNTLYAFIPSSTDSKADIRISNVRTGFTAAYNYTKANKYDLDLGINLNGVTSFDNQKSYYAGVTGMYIHHFDAKRALSVAPSLSVNSINSNVKRSITFFDTKVEYTHSIDKLTVKPSLKFLYESDSIDKKNVHVYPGLEAAYAITNRAVAYGSINSDYSQNLFYDQAKNNPWINNISQFSYLNTPLALVLGFRGTTASFGIDVSGGIKQFKNYVVFASTSLNGDSARMYAINLRDTAVNISFLSANGSYKANETFSIETGLLFQGVSSSFIAKVPNIPAVTWRLAPAFMFQNLMVVPTLIVRSSYNLLTPTLGTVKSGAFYDIATKVSYNLSHRLNMNLDAYNLANNKSFLYYGYRQRGVLVVLGGTFKF